MSCRPCTHRRTTRHAQASLVSSLLLLLLPSHLSTTNAYTPNPVVQSIPPSSSSSYPFSLASSLGFDTYADYPFPVGSTSNWTTDVLASASTTTASTTRTNTKSTTSSTKTTTTTAASATSTSTLVNNATSSTSLLTNLTSSYITDYWALPKGARRIEYGQNDVTFVDDPALYNSTEAEYSGEEELSYGDGRQVLRVEYPEGSYSGGTGGTEFVSTLLANTTSPTSLLLTYSVYVPTNFDFVIGGKLPGLRAGSDYFDCSGGDQSGVGSTCFSLRIMWREGGAGEVYGYIPTSTALCAQGDVICNDDYGTSLGRGLFDFVPGGWNDLALYVKMNTGTGSGDGIVQLYHNNNLSISFTNLTLSTSTALSSLSGLFFSTFFGGSDSTYATPTDQYLYFKDMTVWGNEVNGTGVASTGSVNGSAGTTASGTARGSDWGSRAKVGLTFGTVGLVWGLVSL